MWTGGVVGRWSYGSDLQCPGCVPPEDTPPVPGKSIMWVTCDAHYGQHREWSGLDEWYWLLQLCVLAYVVAAWAGWLPF